MRAFYLILAVLLSTVSASRALAAEDCLRNHLANGRASNLSRAPLYSQLTNGKSEAVSDEMVFFESIGILTALYIDWKADEFQRAGIPVICEDLISMNDIPAFHVNPPPQNESFQPVDEVALALNIRKSYLNQGFSGVVETVSSTLQVLDENQDYHCMTRHILESVRRSAELAPTYVQQAQALQLKDSPAGVSWSFIELELSTLISAGDLDQKTAPFQAQGIPIICQDVPPTPASLL